MSADRFFIICVIFASRLGVQQNKFHQFVLSGQRRSTSSSKHGKRFCCFFSFENAACTFSSFLEYFSFVCPIINVNEVGGFCRKNCDFNCFATAEMQWSVLAMIFSFFAEVPHLVVYSGQKYPFIFETHWEYGYGRTAQF